MGNRKRKSALVFKEDKKTKAFAKLNNCPTSPRKMRLVADQVRGESIEKALSILKFSPKEASRKLEKLLLSALSNWQIKNENKDVEKANLFISEIRVDGGSMLKRLRPAPQGRAHRIRKRSNHVTLILGSKFRSIIMGQKTNPIGNRLGIIRGWDSNWYGGRNYGDKIAEDDKIRKYIHARLSKASVSNVIIERTLKIITITITTARPGIIIGKAGQEVDKLKEELRKITSKEVQINIFEIKRPELDAQLVGSSIARQIESRISYRRAIKMAIAAAIRMNAEGIKIQISGRLNGAEMARSESYKEGRIPLSTFRADIDYALVEAHTTYGRLGIKIWIMKGEVYGKENFLLWWECLKNLNQTLIQELEIIVKEGVNKIVRKDVTT